MKRKSPSKKLATKSRNDVAGKSPALTEQDTASASGAMFWLMAGLSGFACLIYQILWMRQAGLMLGNTSHAAALTLAVFFGGLSLGGIFWGGRCRRHSPPLRTYAWLELGIAISGIALLIAPVILPRVFPLLQGEVALMIFKAIWTLLMVFPAAFFMGGTLPALGQAVIRTRDSFGTTTARMYAVNTLGAACGAFAAAFVLIWFLGLRMTCLTAMAVSIAAAAIAFSLSRHARFQNAAENLRENDSAKDPRKAAQKPTMPRPVIVALAFVSGFNLLALEVVWTRMLAQVHENSVYSFATVLIIVLVCLSLGAWIASRLARSGMSAPKVLIWLLVFGGAALAISPLISLSLTRGLQMLDTNLSFTGYVIQLFATSFAAIAPACLPLGAVFPFLMKGEETFATHAGKSIGALSAINTLGAILGSLAAGFLLLDWLGIWQSIQLISAIYLIAAAVTPASGNPGTFTARIASCAMLLFLFTALDPSKLLDTAKTLSSGEPETLVEKWEGSDCTVSVVRNPRDSLSIKINSNYSLGSTEAYGAQIFQTRIPLFAFPATESVFFLGMGTGITAGEALNRDDFKNITKVVASELTPNVVAASKKYFTGMVDGTDLTNRLYHDPRAQIIIGDGRNHLLVSREKYSMINADLFLPYRRGTGNLYSREHFQIVRERLKPGGVFVQWLPLYQMSEREFGTIAHTMLSVFPQVSLWRGNFRAGAEIAALVGHVDLTPLPASNLDATHDKQLAVEGATHLNMQELMLPINAETILLFYGGNVTRAADLFAKYPLNTDDRPVIEFGTPRSLHQPKGADRPQFLETRFADLVDKLQAHTPPDQDPLLASRSHQSRKLPLAGSAFHRGWIARANGHEETWMNEWKTFRIRWIDTESGTNGP